VSSDSLPDFDEVFFVDRSLGSKRFVQRLRDLGLNAIAHDEIFDPATPDQEWLSRAGDEGWVVVTKDKAIRWRELEKRAVEGANARVFALVPGNKTMDEMLEIFERALPRIREALEMVTPPFIATIAGSGIVRIIHPDGKRQVFG
jgi:predicted nuclease of predicted toxin-antitoxin system